MFLKLYNSDDWDLINDYTYQAYKKMFDTPMAKDS